ncbi:uncharacterized protein LOC107621064 [Arachis ipaensis]|uniref:uncharacterized protein LOC107621064 n=1 Tax=Arachis ipaensis TaxID=130454 RepID=UPI0007AFCE37|nr:uncharacterized protein LOC107621064 [Arachis ipaensis]XP_025685492.1 uncharacterized protein LOC112786317 [Arachis hypogaea]
MSQDHAQLDSGLICKVVLPMIKTDPLVSIPVLQSVVHQSYHFKPSYRKVWMANQKAIAKIYGDWKESYNRILALLQALQECLPGTIHECNDVPYYNGDMVDGEWSQFDKVFWIFPPCIEAFKHCKLFVSMDGTHLYGKYGGVLLISVAQDGILIISDRSQAIRAALNAPHNGWHPPSAYHAYRIRYMASNFNSRFKSTEGKRYLINAAYSLSKEGCDWYLDALGTLSREMVDWALRFRKELWLQHCDEGRRYGHMTTNLSECINAMLKGTRNLPMAAIVRATYERLQQLFVRKGREALAQLQGRQIHSQRLLEAIDKNRESLPMLRVTHCDRRTSVFSVKEMEPLDAWSQTSYRVRLSERTCDCGLFQSLHYPCRHALAACAAASIE